MLKVKVTFVGAFWFQVGGVLGFGLVLPLGCQGLVPKCRDASIFSAAVKELRLEYHSGDIYILDIQVYELW